MFSCLLALNFFQTTFLAVATVLISCANYNRGREERQKSSVACLDVAISSNFAN